MAKDNKPKKQKKPIKIWAIATAIILVIAIALNVVLFKVPLVTGSLDLFFGGERPILAEGSEGAAGSYKSKAEVLAAAENFVVEVEQEGITLLKNEGAALPLAGSAKVSVFGKNSVNLVYSGSGSAGNSSSSVKTLYESLEAAGIQCNPALKTFYGDSGKSGAGRPGNPAMTSGQRLAGFATGETPVASYTADVTGTYKDYADAAIVVISRIGGEGFDLPRSMATDFTSGKAVEGAVSPDSHYLQLDANERDLLRYGSHIAAPRRR